jgi:hypothetical protein
MKAYIYNVTRKGKTYELKIPARSRKAADESVARMKGHKVMQIKFTGTLTSLEQKAPRIRVDKKEFVKVHGHEPDGFASWWFDIPGVGLWRPTSSCTYKEALKQATVRAHLASSKVIKVVPFHRTTEEDLVQQGATV